jgi:hypothetical protein
MIDPLPLRGVPLERASIPDGPGVGKITVQPSPLTNLTIVLPIAIDRTAEGCLKLVSGDG